MLCIGRHLTAFIDFDGRVFMEIVLILSDGSVGTVSVETRPSLILAVGV